MFFLDINQRNYVIISDNNILLDALTSNTDYIFYKNDRNIKKVDILIIDSEKEIDRFSLFRANIIINLTKNKITDREISFTKPFFFKYLIEIISKNALEKNLFCSINANWIYNERTCSLLSQDETITLTNRENDLFKSLLLSDNLTISKDILSREVWEHSKNVESTTIETHIYKLKQKLPNGLLEIQNSYYTLNPNFIVL